MTDLAGFARLYRHIGRPSGGDPNQECYETDTAVAVGTRALADFWAAMANARRASRAVNGGH